MTELNTIERPEAGGGGWLINHLPAILWHRRLYVIVPAVLLFAVGVITAFQQKSLMRLEPARSKSELPRFESRYSAVET